MKPLNNLLNKTFERLTVTKRVPNPGRRKNDTAAWWECQCSCGNTVVVRGYSLTTGHTKSCGCLKLEGNASCLGHYAVPKFTPSIVAAKQAWISRYQELPFEVFCELAQKDCQRHSIIYQPPANS